MADSQVIARRFRPKTFGEVVGQEAITRTLANSIAKNRLHHAYLFAGARGVGKTTTARILAKALNCKKGPTPDPCDVCDSCLEIAASSSLDVREMDAASNTGIDDVRETIVNSIGIGPARDRYKIFIIDEIHQLSTKAFDALLKTIEEPPPHVLFIMATTEMQKVPETILSRCQVYEFRTIAPKRITEQLRHVADTLGVEISDSALAGIARAGEGSMRDAESALDQVISFAGNSITEDDVSAALGLVGFETLNATLRAINDQDALKAISAVEEIVALGYDLRNFCRDLMAHLRTLLVIKIAGTDSELIEAPPGEVETLASLAGSLSEQDIVRFFTILTKTEQDVRISSQPRFQLEIGLVKMAHARRLDSVEESLARLTALQEQLWSLGALPAGPEPGGTPARPPRTASTAAPPANRLAQRPQPGKAANPRRDAPPVDDYDEPPMLEPPDEEMRPVSRPGARPASASNSTGDIERLKNALEAKRKMMIVSAIDKAESVKLEGDVLKVAFKAGAKIYKSNLEGRDARKSVEDACQEVFGRAITLLVSNVSAALQRADQTEQKGPRAEDDPVVRALVEKFHGEVVEVTDPDQ